ncbi:MAG: hypothetical protein IJS44_06295 [Clostridia bacterium]|nr:hypothetical protein [Clostridia bacterium]
MKKPVLIFTVCLLFCIGLVSVSAAGTSIGTADELVALMQDTTKWGDDCKLTADINLSGKAQTPIGSYAIPFTGTFDGGNHTISGISISTEPVAGLFGVIENATVKDLSVKGNVTNLFAAENAETKVEEKYPATGGLVAVVLSGSRIENCTSDMRVNATASGNCGGMIGIVYNFGASGVQIANCKTYGNASGALGNAGAMISRIYIKTSAKDGCIVSGCTNYADIDLRSEDRCRVGGVVGYVRTEMGKIRIEKCQNEGKISGSNSFETGSNITYAGGIAGRCEVTSDWTACLEIVDCVNNGVIQSGSIGGGITAYISRGDACGQDVTIVKDCKNNAKVTGPYFAGGIVAYSASKAMLIEASRIENCTNSGAIDGESCAGGLFGQQDGFSILGSTNTAKVSGSGKIGAVSGKVGGSVPISVKDTTYAPDAAENAFGEVGDIADVSGAVAIGAAPVVVTEAAPETTAAETEAETTAAEESAAETETAEVTETEVVPESAEETAAESETSPDGAPAEAKGNSAPVGLILGIAAAVIVIAAVVVLLLKKKQK